MSCAVRVDNDPDEQHLRTAGPADFEPRRQLDLEVELVGFVGDGHRPAGDSLEVPDLGIGHCRGQRSGVAVSDDGVAAIECRSLRPELAFEDPGELERCRNGDGDRHRFADEVVDGRCREDGGRGDRRLPDSCGAGDANRHGGDRGVAGCLQFHLDNVFPLGDCGATADGHTRRQVLGL